MSFFYLATLFLAFAQCPQECPAQTTVETIKAPDIDILRSQHRGCYILLELWASWCTSCKKSKPALMKIVSAYPELKHLSLSADYRATPIKRYIRKLDYIPQKIFFIRGWTVENLTAVFKKFNGDFKGAIPFIMLISPKGDILYQSTEAKEYSRLDAILKKELSTP